MKAKPITRIAFVSASLFAAVASVIVLDHAGRSASAWWGRTRAHVTATAGAAHLAERFVRALVCVAKI